MSTNATHPTSFEKIELSPFVKRAKTISLMIIGAMLLLLLLPWEQTTKGNAKLIALDPSERDFTIAAPITGFIKEYSVKENHFVKKGELLLEMHDLDKEYLPKLNEIASNIKTEQTNTTNTLSLLEDQKSNLVTNLTTGIEIHNRKIAQIEDSLNALQNTQMQVKNTLSITKTNFERIEDLYKEGIESKRNYELAQNDFVRLSTELERTLIAIQREKKALEIQKKEKEQFIKTQQNAIASMQERLIVTQNRLTNLEKELTNATINISRNTNAKIYATKDGYPLRIFANDRDRYVKVGDPLIYFAPKVSKRVLLTKVRSLDMPLIKAGLKARIQFNGWPSLQVAGWPKITFGTFGGIVEKVDPIAHQDGSYYAYIVEDPNEPWPADDVLKMGTNASVWIRLSTVTIGYEIWRLHNAMPQRMVNPKAKHAEVKN